MNSSLLTQLGSKGRTVSRLRTLYQYYSTESEPIVIPKRIPRSPTDILRAISHTVQPDPTAAHYKFHDDPYLIPYSNSSKRSYALSQEAGRKAAQWIRQQHSDLFQHKVADPPIKVFSPKAVFDENSEVSEEILNNLIASNSVSDAITVFNLLEGKSIDLSHATKQSLLELICYFNSTDPLQEDWIEERWYMMSTKSREVVKNVWKDNGIAEKLFSSLKPPDSLSYSAVISGMCAHGEVDKAWKYYQDSIQEKVQINVTAFNALLARVNFIKESHDLMWGLVEDLLSEMNRRGLKPNLRTLNSILETLSVMSANQNSKNNALMVIAEFKQFGIEPSLASYYHLLNIFCKKRGPVNGILIDIMNHIEGQAFKVVDLNDTNFFVRAMDVCHNHLHDKELAYRVDRLLHTENNINLIGDSYRESLYYRSFLTLLCDSEALEDFMEIYCKLVPNIYIPEPSVMLHILNTVELNGALEYLPKLWSDMVQFDHADRDNLLAKMLECAAKNIDESLAGKLADIGWRIWEKIEDQKRERNLIMWSGAMLGDLLMIFIQANEKDKAVMVLDKLDSMKNNIVGEPNILPLQLLLDVCIKDASISTALKCIRYCHDIGFFEVDDMARKLHSTSTLSDKELAQLVNIVGEKTLKQNQKDDSQKKSGQ